MSNTTIQAPVPTRKPALAAAAEIIQTIPSFQMNPRKKLGCKFDGQLVVSLYIPGSSYCWNQPWDYLKSCGFDFKAATKSFIVEVYAGNTVILANTPGHPLSRKPDERQGEWLDRICNHSLCKGISVVILASALTKAQVDRLYNTLAPCKYDAAASASLVAAFCSGEAAEPPRLAPAPPQPPSNAYSTSIKLKASAVEPVVAAVTVESVALVSEPVAEPVSAIDPAIAEMTAKEIKAAWFIHFGYPAPSIRTDDLRLLYAAKLAAR